MLCCAASCLFLLGLFLRFANRHIAALDAMSPNAYGMYLVHYLFSIWLQFALLGLAIFVVVKAAIVFTGTLFLSWGAIATLRRIPTAARIVGTERRVASGTH